MSILWAAVQHQMQNDLKTAVGKVARAIIDAMVLDFQGVLENC